MRDDQCISENFYLAGCYLEITSKCNLQCIHCYNESGTPKDIINMATFNSIVNSLPNNQKTSLTLSGGEPLTHPDLWKFIELLKTKKFSRPLIITNATLINREIARKFSNYNIGIQISLNGSCAEVHDKLCGTGNFERTMRGLNYLLDEGLNNNIIVRCVLNNFNKNDITDFINFLGKKKIKQIDIAVLSTLGRSKNHLSHLAITPEEKSKLVKEWTANSQIIKIQENGITINFPDDFTGMCPFLSNKKEGDEKLPLTPRIDSSGQVFICQIFADSEYSIGNIYKQNLDDILHGIQFARLIEFLKLSQDYMHECKKCIWNSVCGKGCVAMAVANGGSVQDTDGCCSLRKKHFKLALKGSTAI